MATINKQNVVGLTDALGGSAAGLISMWALRGPMRLMPLVHQWNERGLAPSLLPTLPSTEVALRRAMQDKADRSNGGRVARALKRPKDAGWVSAWVLTRERRDENRVEYEHSDDVIVRLMRDDTLHFEAGGLQHALCTEINAAYCRFQSEFATQDVSAWLTGRLMPCVRGLPMRDSGGVYFIASEFRSMWEDMTDAIGAVSGHLFFSSPAMPGDKAVAFLLDALTTSVEESIARVEAKLCDDDLGVRALRTQQVLLEQEEARLSYWESLLGRSLTGLHERTERVRAGLAVAVLSAEAEK